jgi:NAD(P)-dependent dehydrogenase (short-subunit alcohol dehydrogenase family)
VTLQNQKVIVIGGTSGIGLATAKAARELDADVVIAARDENELRTAADEIGDSTESRRVDATQRPALDDMFDDLGALDHLVLSASAGPSGSGPIATLDLAHLRAGFEGKFWPFVTALQAALPHIRRDGGSVTFVSAASAGASLEGTAGFAAINGALEAMVPPLAVELKPLRINAVSPGLVRTRFWQALPANERSAMFDRYVSATPVGRIGTAEDVAQAIVSLIGNTFITGTVLTVDGGLTLSPPQ